LPEGMRRIGERRLTDLEVSAGLGRVHGRVPDWGRSGRDRFRHGGGDEAQNDRPAPRPCAGTLHATSMETWRVECDRRLLTAHSSEWERSGVTSGKVRAGDEGGDRCGLAEMPPPLAALLARASRCRPAAYRTVGCSW